MQTQTKMSPSLQETLKAPLHFTSIAHRWGSDFGEISSKMENIYKTLLVMLASSNIFAINIEINDADADACS